MSDTVDALREALIVQPPPKSFAGYVRAVAAALAEDGWSLIRSADIAPLLDLELLARAITATLGYTDAEMDEPDEEGKTVVDYHAEWWQTPRLLALNIAAEYARLATDTP